MKNKVELGGVGWDGGMIDKLLSTDCPASNVMIQVEPFGSHSCFQISGRRDHDET